MKRMWQNMLVVAALLVLTGTASAQDAFSQPSAIGSYQSILSRAGYGQSMGSMTRTPQAVLQGVPMQGTAVQGGAMYGMQNVQGTMSGATIQSAPVVAAPMAGGQVMSAPAMSAPAMSAPAMSAPMATAPMVSAPVSYTHLTLPTKA